MTTPHRCASVGLLLAGIGGILAFADEPAPAVATPAKNTGSSRWVFSLLPKSLQRNPSLDFHVITEMTAAGRTLAPPTPQHPVYYLEQPGKFTQLGTEKPANEHPPVVADLERAMQGALAVNGYLPAAPATPGPRLFVVMTFGSFARFSTDAADFQQATAIDNFYRDTMSPDSDSAPPPFVTDGGERDASSLLPVVLSDPSARANVIERAELIGGTKFAQELGAVLNAEAAYEKSRADLMSPMVAMASPFNRFVNANDSLMELVEESFNSCYFVIASAYDFAAMTKGQRVLYWRTKMTVNSIGISMTQSLTPLIASAGPYFGRDMTEAATITRRVVREGKVEVGTPQVLDDDSTPPANAPADGKIPAPAKP